MKMGSEQLYLDLLKKSLSFALWPEPPVPLTVFSHLHSPPKRFVLNTVAKWLKKKNWLLVKDLGYSAEERREGRIWPSNADTMIGLLRLDNLQACVETILREGTEGDFIETGVWRGGACIFMRGILAAYGVTNRKVYLADSFAGLPTPDADNYPADQGDAHHVFDFLRVSQEQVQANFQRYGLWDDQVVFLKGWFKDTLPHAPMKKLALLRLDGDMYQSTIEALDNLYPKLSPGGFCIIDDYALAGCQKAVDDYRAQHQIMAQLEVIDASSRFWKKP